jgi:uncharacterized membrane protein
MESKAKLFGHPIHQMLIVFPLGLLATSILFDVVYLITKNGQWALIAFWLIAAGVIGGLVAAPFGLVDWLGIPAGTRAKRIGSQHGLINVAVLILFGSSWLIRNHAPTLPDNLCFGLSWAGLILSMVSGWLGGELVDRLGVGVDAGANVNAPSSLSSRSAQENAPPSPQTK